LSADELRECWFEVIKARPATVRAYEKGAAISSNATMTEEAKKILFGQTARSNTQA